MSFGSLGKRAISNSRMYLNLHIILKREKINKICSFFLSNDFYRKRCIIKRTFCIVAF